MIVALFFMTACDDSDQGKSASTATTAATTAAPTTAAATATATAAASAEAEDPKVIFDEAMAACQKLLDCKAAVEKEKVDVPAGPKGGLGLAQRNVDTLKQMGKDGGETIKTLRHNCQNTLRMLAKQTDGKVPKVCQGY